MVYAKRPFAGPEQVLDYVGRYTHRVAISNNRLLDIAEAKVTFRYKDYRHGAQQKTMTLEAEEFIRRFLLHVLPKGFCKIRYFGIFACRNRSTMLAKCRAFFKHTLIPSKFAGLSWQKALELACGINVQVCPVCKKGRMITTSVMVGKRAPP